MQERLFMLTLFQKELSSRFNVRVTPKASANHLKIEESHDGTILVRVYITIPAEKGKANQQVIPLLARHFNWPKTRFFIIRGHSVRNKVFGILPQ